MAGAIEHGVLPLGARLPPERALAHDLVVSRGTVSAAYDLLKNLGLLESQERGSTTVVGRQRYRSFVTTRAGYIEPGAREGTSDLIRGAADTIDLSIAGVLPVPALADAGRALFERFAEQPLAELAYAPMGLMTLREAVADAFSRSGCPTTPDNILITSGAHQAIAIVLALWLTANDVVLIEDPSFPGVFDLLRTCYARSVAVPTDENGIVAEALEEAAAAHQAHLVFLSNAFHNPSGAMVPVERRERIARLSARHDIPVIEDNALIDTPIGGTNPGPRSMSAFAPDAPIFSVGSVDKSLWTGLRVGWVRAPARFLQRLRELKAVADLMGSLPAQHLAAALLPDDASRDLRAAELTARCAVLERELGRAFPEWRWTSPAGGLSLWVDTGRDDGARFAAAARRYGVRAGSGSWFSATNPFPRHLRFTYSLPEEHIVEGVRRLRLCWDALPGARGG